MKFKNQIWMGYEKSPAEIKHAKRLLDSCLDILNGIQQDGLCGYPSDIQEVIKQKKLLKRKTRELVLGLTGCTIKLD